MCHIYRKLFARKCHLKSHLSSHENKKEHSCYVCGDIFKDLKTFTEHCKSHSDHVHIRTATTSLSNISMTEEAQYHTAEVPVVASSHTQYAHSTSPPHVHSLTDEVSVSQINNPYNCSYLQLAHQPLFPQSIGSEHPVDSFHPYIISVY